MAVQLEARFPDEEDSRLPCQFSCFALRRPGSVAGNAGARPEAEEMRHRRQPADALRSHHGAGGCGNLRLFRPAEDRLHGPQPGDWSRPSLGAFVHIEGGPGYALRAAPIRSPLAAVMAPFLKRRN